MQNKKKVPAFLRSTYEMLERKEIQQIVSWSQDGQGFIIKNVDLFSTIILPQYFKHKKYSSFVRQLNMYGFHKQRQQLNHHFFAHQQFRRGVLEGSRSKVTLDIRRKPQKKKKMDSLGKGEEGAEDGQRSEEEMSVESSGNQNSVSIVMNGDKENKKQCSVKHSEEISHQKPGKGKRRESVGEIVRPEEQSNNMNELASYFKESLTKSMNEDVILRQNEILTQLHEPIRKDVLQMKRASLQLLEDNIKNQIPCGLLQMMQAKIEELSQLFLTEADINE